MILVTGANGFVGQSLCKRLASDNMPFRRAVRANSVSSPDNYTWPVGEIGQATDWGPVLEGVTTIVHLANRAHVMYEQTANPLRLYRNINVEGTHNLARQATIAGVQRFIYISSIKVNGERTMDRPFREDDVPRPEGAYSISKWEAEQALAHVAATSSLDVVILRPPLIYGPGVRANFLLLMKAIRRGIPLPFGNVHNQRSLLYLGNLTDAIVTCINHPRAAGKTYVLSDNEDLSTTDLLRGLANAMGSPSRLLPIPTPFLRLAGKVIGKTDAMDRLIGSLVVDSYKIRQELNWNPPYTISQGLHETASWFLHNR